MHTLFEINLVEFESHKYASVFYSNQNICIGNKGSMHYFSS